MGNQPDPHDWGLDSFRCLRCGTTRDDAPDQLCVLETVAIDYDKKTVTVTPADQPTPSDDLRERVERLVTRATEDVSTEIVLGYAVRDATDAICALISPTEGEPGEMRERVEHFERLLQAGQDEWHEDSRAYKVWAVAIERFSAILALISPTEGEPGEMKSNGEARTVEHHPNGEAEYQHFVGQVVPLPEPGDSVWILPHPPASPTPSLTEEEQEGLHSVLSASGLSTARNPQWNYPNIGYGTLYIERLLNEGGEK